MFCSKCGGKNSDEAVYCQKCGTLLDADREEETRVRPTLQKREILTNQPTDDETEARIFTIRPTLMFVKIGYAAAVLGAFLLVALLATIDKNWNINISWWLYVLFGFVLLLIPAFYHLKRSLIRYTLTDSKIEIDEGFISQKRRNIPLRNIQDVSVNSTISQRMLGFGDLIIENASESGSKIILKNVNSPQKYADALLKQMRQLNR